MKTNSTKKITLFLTVLLALNSTLLIIPSGLSLTQITESYSNNFIIETMQLQLNASSYKLNVENGKTKIEMDDFGVLTKPGYPQIPSKIFTIALPSNAIVPSVEATHISSKNIGTFNLTTQADYYQLDNIKQKKLPNQQPPTKIYIRDHRMK